MSDLSQVAVYSDSSDIYKVSEDDEMDDDGAVLWERSQTFSRHSFGTALLEIDNW